MKKLLDFTITTKQQFYILFACLLVYGFIYTDVYLLPLQKTSETILRRDIENERLRNGRVHSYYFVYTTCRKYEIGENAYNNTALGDRIELRKSFIANAPQKLSMLVGKDVYTYEIGYMRARSGYILVPIFIAAIFFFLIFYKIVGNDQGKLNLTLSFMLITVGIFYYYFDFEFSFWG